MNTLKAAPPEKLSSIITAMRSALSQILDPSPSPFPKTTKTLEKKRGERVRTILSAIAAIIEGKEPKDPPSLLTELPQYTIEEKDLRRAVQKVLGNHIFAFRGITLLRDIWNACSEEDKTDYIFRIALFAAGESKNSTLLQEIWNACPDKQKTIWSLKIAICAAGKCKNSTLLREIWKMRPTHIKHTLLAAGQCNDSLLVREIWKMHPTHTKYALLAAAECQASDLFREIWNKRSEYEKSIKDIQFARSVAEKFQDSVLLEEVRNELLKKQERMAMIAFHLK